VAGVLLVPGVIEVFLKAAADVIYMGKDYAAVVFESIK